MLRLSRLTDYAIMLLGHLGSEGEGATRTARELAAASHLSAPTVSKLLKALSHAGLLTSHRGARGGYSLAQRPAQIPVTRVISAIEGPLALTACDQPDGRCDLQPYCPVTGSWQAIGGAVRSALDRLTLADLLTPAPRSKAAPPVEAR